MNLNRILTPLALAALAVHQWFIWQYAPVAQSGPVQKIFYLHLPLAWWALVSFFTVFAASILFLWKRSEVWDDLAGAAAEVGVLFSGLALVSGSIWARAEWGHWWLWDPKLTTALIMWYVYAGYLVLRASPLGGERRQIVAAVLGVVAFLDVPLVFFATRLWGGVHPADTARKASGMTGSMWHTVFVGLAAFGVLWLVFLLARRAQRTREKRLDAEMAERLMEDGEGR
ncbi:heme exporter protein C [Paucidesulfovibrio gracilis DSM 16080]|uniref:Heme exporter protein C n=1 Tax=Paucidesulfovibrio gracilis DSM 16080 TaxID=1121449 RepID=A0A1T4W0W2_9BACT|nr:cytochrome c biogenesis protein CcsA [Paucidesulfovibrio gracilis]SKA70880.1 heme exporter protein C [Paucidesulfovibrio gracilis DSM 16080]